MLHGRIIRKGTIRILNGRERRHVIGLLYPTEDLSYPFKVCVSPLCPRTAVLSLQLLDLNVSFRLVMDIHLGILGVYSQFGSRKSTNHL